MVCKFADIAKAPTDLLSDDYTTKVSLKCKKSAGPVAVTIDTTKGTNGALASKIGTKFSYAGLSFDKAQLEANGGKTLETSICPTPGLKVSFKGGKGADLGCDYKTGNFVGTAKLDVKDLAKISSSACVGLSGGFTIGGDASYSLKDSSFSGYNFGGNYSKGPIFASLTSVDKFSSFNVSMMYKVNPEFCLASSTSHSSSKHSLLALGGSYKASFGDIKAKVGNDGVMSACFIKEVVPKVKVTASGTMSGIDTSTFKYGLGLTM